MFKFKLSDGSELTLSVNITQKQIEITQTWPLDSSPVAGVRRPVSTIIVPLADVSSIAKTFRELRAYFG